MATTKKKTNRTAKSYHTPKSKKHSATASRKRASWVAPLVREPIYVGLGMLDVAWEAFWVAEQALATRGQKRSEELGKTFSEVRGTISETTAQVQQGAKRRAQRMRSAVEEGYRSVAQGTTAKLKPATT